MNILCFLEKISPLDIRDGEIENRLSNILWVTKTIQYCENIKNQSIAPVRVFKDRSDRYRIVDGFDCMEALIICKRVIEGNLKGKYYDLLFNEVMSKDILLEDIIIEVIDTCELKYILSCLCIDDIKKETFTKNDCSRTTITELIKKNVENRYNVEKWYLLDCHILDLFITYITGYGMYQGKLGEVRKSEILDILPEFVPDSFYNYLVNSNINTKNIMKHLSIDGTEFHYGHRFMIPITTANHISKREGNSVKSVDDFVTAILNQDSRAMLSEMKKIKSNISTRMYNLIKVTAYLYMTGKMKTLDWSKVNKEYLLI